MKIALIHHQISSLMTTKAIIMQFWNLRRKSNLQMENLPLQLEILQLWISPHASLHCDFKVWFAFKFQEFYSITGTALGWEKGEGRFSSGINSQSLEGTQVGYISQKYTLDNYTLKNTLRFGDQLNGLGTSWLGWGPVDWVGRVLPEPKFEKKCTSFF